MGLLKGFMAAVSHLLLVALDVAILLCMVRLVSRRTSWDILQDLDDAGEPVVEWVIKCGRKGLTRVTGESTEEGPALAAGMGALLAARFAVIVLFNLTIAP